MFDEPSPFAPLGGAWYRSVHLQALAEFDLSCRRFGITTQGALPMTFAGQPESVQRDESQDDYDLLTYGEVAARLTEEMAVEADQIAELQKSGTEPATLHALQERFALLAASKRRYEQQAQTAEIFMRRFGLTPRESGQPTS
jgi:hypothetical protein